MKMPIDIEDAVVVCTNQYNSLIDASFYFDIDINSDIWQSRFAECRSGGC